MKSIAMCIPTYERPEVIEDVLGHFGKQLHDAGIDLYYYDGSSDDRTQNIIRKYQKLGLDNLYHLSLPNLGMAERCAMFFRGEGLLDEYEYIWPCKEKAWFSDVALSYVLACALEKADIIFIGNNRPYDSRVDVYTDHVEFYNDWGWRATSIDVVIYKWETMVKGFTEWKEPRFLNTFYCHMFERFVELESVCINVISGRDIVVHNSSSEPRWRGQAFEIWGDNLIQENERLPACYDLYKEKVIKETAAAPGVLNMNSLLRLAKEGILNLDSLEHIRENWERISDIPACVLEDIAKGTYDKRHDLRLLVPNEEITQMLVQSIDMLHRGVLLPTQIPIDSISAILSDAIRQKSNSSYGGILMIKGTLEDMKDVLQGQDVSIDTACGILQIIMGYFAVLGMC